MIVTLFDTVCFSRPYDHQGFVESTESPVCNPDQDLFVHQDEVVGSTELNMSTEIKGPSEIFGYNIDWKESRSLAIRFDTRFSDIEFYSVSSGNESSNMKIDGNGKAVIGGGLLDSDINCISNYKIFVQDGIRTEKVEVESIRLVRLRLCR